MFSDFISLTCILKYFCCFYECKKRDYFVYFVSFASYEIHT